MTGSSHWNRTGVPVAASWKQASNRDVWQAGATALQSYAVQSMNDECANTPTS